MKILACRGYTLLELCVTLVTLSVMAAVLSTVMASALRERAHRSSSPRELQQLGAAMLQYAQDNDETLPPAYAVDTLPGNAPTASARSGKELAPIPPAHFAPFTAHFWQGQVTFSEGDKPQYRLDSGGLLPLLPRQESGAGVRTPSAKRAGYMVSDLAGSATMAAFITPINTVVAMESEDGYPAIGHAYALNITQLAPIWNKKKHEIVVGAAVDKAATRNSNGANYLFADGHARWQKGESVFFPSRYSDHRTHLAARTGEAIGPDPGSDMTYTERTHERTYSATFHLR